MKTRKLKKNMRKNKTTKTLKKTRLGKGKTKCCICNKSFDSKDALIPAKCLGRKGMENAHKICQDCWWGEFATEGVNHDCPGCVKEPRPKKRTSLTASKVIDLISSSD
jgi:hypothetical protein